MGKVLQFIQRTHLDLGAVTGAVTLSDDFGSVVDSVRDVVDLGLF